MLFILSSVTANGQEKHAYVNMDSVIFASAYYSQVKKEIDSSRSIVLANGMMYLDSLQSAFEINFNTLIASLDTIWIESYFEELETYSIRQFDASMSDINQELYYLDFIEYNKIEIELGYKIQKFSKEIGVELLMEGFMYKEAKGTSLTSQFCFYLLSDTTHLEPQDYLTVLRSCY